MTPITNLRILQHGIGTHDIQILELLMGKTASGPWASAANCTFANAPGVDVWQECGAFGAVQSEYIRVVIRDTHVSPLPKLREIEFYQSDEGWAPHHGPRCAFFSKAVRCSGCYPGNCIRDQQVSESTHG